MSGVMMNRKIGFIGGGNLAEAIIGGIIKNRVVEPEHIIVSDARSMRAAYIANKFKIVTRGDNISVLADCDIVFLTVKPQVLAHVLAEISDHIREGQVFISPCAGITTRSIEKALGRDAPVVRIMPNIAALVDESATALTTGAHVAPDQMNEAIRVCESFGMVEPMDEDLMDAVTGLSGSGPAYVFLIMDALADAGVKVGLRRDQARRLVAQTVKGAAQLLMETGEHPSELKDMVTSPGGTAITGLAALEEGGLRTTLISAVENATKRAQQLGDLLEGE